MRGQAFSLVLDARARVGIAVLLWLASSAVGAGQSPAFLPVGEPQRIPEPGLERLHVDGQGLVWLSTQYGVYRWDGHDVLSHLPDPADPDALPAGEILDLSEDAGGRLWLASRNAGLIRLDPARDESRAWRSAQGLASDHLLRVVTGPRGRIWFTDDAGTLGHLDPHVDPLLDLGAPGSIDRLPLDPGLEGATPYPALEAGPEGIWAGGPAGLRFVPAANRRAQTIPLLAADGPPGEVVGISANEHGAVAVATSRRIWVRDARGYFQPRYRADPEAGEFQDILHGPDGGIWVAGDTALLRLDSDGRDPRWFRQDPLDPDSYPAADAQSLAAGPDGLIWAVTRGEGLVRVIEPLSGLERIGRDPQALDVLTVSRQDGGLWFGTLDRGMVAIEESGAPGRIHPLETGRENQAAILATAPSGEHALWIADEDLRLWRMQLDSGDRRRLHRPLAELDRDRTVAIADLYEDDADRLWIATLGDGLHRYDPETDTVQVWRAAEADVHGLSSDYPQRLYEDDAGRLWLGSDDQGLFRYQDGAFQPVAAGEAGIGEASVEAMVQDAAGKLWVGLFPGGLAVLDPEDPEQPPRRYTTEDGLPGNDIAGLEIDASGQVWVSTSGGLARYAPDEGFLTFGYAQGLTGPILNAGAHARDDQGRPVFGGTEGALRVDGESLADSALDRSPRISQIRVDGERVTPDRMDGAGPHKLETLALDHEQVQVELNLYLPDYRDTRVHEYRYRLDPEADWIHLADREPVASLTHPEPGRHELEYQARGPDGLWTAADQALVLDVAPPPWQTPWAYTAYSLSLGTALLLAALSWRRRTRREALLAQERAQRRWVEQLHGLVLNMAEPVDRETLVRRFLQRLREILPLAAARVELDGLERLPPLSLTEGTPGSPAAGRDLPLATRQRRLGRMRVWPSTSAGFRARDLAALRAVADQAATALESSLLMAEADSANRAKSAFLAKISHEIRTPLSGMLGLAGLMLEQRDEDLRRSDLETLRNSGRGLMAILDDILDNARLEAGRMELRSRPFDLVAAVEESLDLFVPRARQQGLALASRVDGRLPRRVLGDEVRFRQVLGNLVSNAVKFTRQGSVRVEIAAGETDWLELAVVDTGPGLSDEDRRRLFHPYARDDQRREEGTGLGLVICRDLIALMGGELAVDSAPGRGSRFSASLHLPWRGGARPHPRQDCVLRFDQPPGPVGELLVRRLRDWGIRVLGPGDPAAGGSEIPVVLEASSSQPGVLVLRSPNDTAPEGLSLPLREAELAAWLDRLVTGESPPATQAPEAERRGHRGGRVLVAEDNPINARVVTDVLAGAGYQVTLAANGREVLDRLAEVNFDAVLMDRHMPEMDGLEATRRLREAQSQSAPPVIGLTAAVSAEEHGECLAAGMDRVVTKDGDPGPLLTALAEALESRPRA